MATKQSNRNFWIIFFGLMLAIASGVVLYVWVTLQPLPAAPISQEYLQNSSQVTVNRHDWGLEFLPSQPKGGLAFYPGARVEYTAYAPVLRAVAEAGYVVAMMQAPFGLAITRVNQAAAPIALHPNLPWAVGGHSLGGVAASNYTQQNPNLKALVLMASYPQTNLSASSLPTLALFGELDGLLGPEQARQESSKMPQGAEVVFVPGLNHSGYAAYGPQQGDLEATLPKDQAWNEVSRLVVTFLDRHLAP